MNKTDEQNKSKEYQEYKKLRAQRKKYAGWYFVKTY